MPLFILPEIVLLDATITTKEEAIRAIVARLVAAGEVRREDHEQAIRGILKRETLGSTAIGKGVAIPHTTLSAGQHFIVAKAWSENGVLFDGVENRIVHVICLMIAPSGLREDYLRVMELIARILRTPPGA